MNTETQTGSRPQTHPFVFTEPVPVTGEALYHMGGLGRVELIRGEIKRLMPTGHLHGYIETIIASLLLAFVQSRQLGRVLSGEVGIYTRRKPDTVRGADVVYISQERLAQTQSEGYLTVAPELVVEVMSPGDTWTEVQEKVQEYFAVGVQLMWVIDPRLKQIHVYRSADEAIRLTVHDELTGDDLLPGFAVRVSQIFV